MRHQTTDKVAFGIEGYGGVEDIAGAFAGIDRHRLGPVVYVGLGRAGHELVSHDDSHNSMQPGMPAANFAFGVLFGLNDDTSDLALKWDADIEF